MNYISICTDLAQLATDFPDLFDAEAGDPKRGKLIGWSGDYTVYNSNQSMKVLTSIEGLDEIAEKDYITVTSYEEIFGYRRQVVLDDVPQFGEPTVTVVPAYTPQVITRYEDDLDRPIYKVVRHEKQKTVTRTHDEEGNEYPEPLVVPVVKVSYTYTEDGEIDQTIETPVMVLDYYETTDEIEGYHQKPIYGPQQEWIQVLEPTGEVDEFDNPIMVDNGYWQDVVIPESSYETPNPIMEEVPGNAELKALYDSIYDQTPVTDEEGNVHTPPKLFAVPGGAPTDHLL